MNIEYVARNLELDDRIRDYTNDKLEKVSKFLDEPVDIHVTLEKEKHRSIAEFPRRRGVIISDRT